MEIFDFDRLLESGEKRNIPSVITIGVFDGGHEAHRKIIKKAIEKRNEKPGREAMVITFSSNPKPSNEGALDTMRIRAEIMEEMGVNSFVVIDFSQEFSRISACGFVRLLMRLTSPEAIVVGDDFRFGHPSSAASARDLEAMFLKEGKSVEIDIVEQILTEGGEKISSTLLRRLIKKGELNEYHKLTGQSYKVDLMPIPYRICDGYLVFCTKTIHQLLPPLGAYDTELRLADGRSLKAVLELTEEFLRFALDDFASVFGSHDLSGKVKVQLNYLFFGEKR